MILQSCPIIAVLSPPEKRCLKSSGGVFRREVDAWSLLPSLAFLSPLPAGFLLINRRLGYSAHGIVSLLPGCHTHFNEQREPARFVVVQPVLTGVGHGVLAGVWRGAAALHIEMGTKDNLGPTGSRPAATAGGMVPQGTAFWPNKRSRKKSFLPMPKPAEDAVPDPTEKKRATCTHCSAGFMVPGTVEGKTAKCPKCSKSFTIAFEHSAPLTPPTPCPSPSLSPPAPTLSKRISVPMWALVAGPSLVSLAVGYFAGREHLKYQMRSAVADVGRAFVQGIKDSLPPGLQETVDREEEKPRPPPRVAIGTPYNSGRFSVEVRAASILHPEVKGLTGDKSPSEDPLLVIELLFTSKDDRKVVTFRDDRVMGGSVFRLKDDVGNVVRPVTFGFTSKVVGAMDKFAALKPEESLTHLQVFDVPLPKTKSLVLNVDLYCFEGDGEVEVEIPIAAVKKDNE